MRQSIFNIPAVMFLSFDAPNHITLWNEGILIGSYASQQQAEQAAHKHYEHGE